MQRIRVKDYHGSPGWQTVDAENGPFVFYAEAAREIGALQEQLAAEKIEGGRLRGELAARDASFLYHYSKKRPEQLPWVPKKVTLYAPATLAEPPYLWKRVVRGSRDEEVHRRAGWQEARDSDALKHEPGQIPPSRSDWEGHEAAMLRKRGVGDQIIAAAKRMDVEQGGLRLSSLEEVTAQLLTISDGVDVRLDMLDEDVERLKGRGTVAAALDAAILDRVRALEARCPGQEERICKLEAELGDILSVWPGVVARCIGLEDGETKLKERLAALEIGVWKAEGRLCTLESQSKHSTT